MVFIIAVLTAALSIANGELKIYGEEGAQYAFGSVINSDPEGDAATEMPPCTVKNRAPQVCKIRWHHKGHAVRVLDDEAFRWPNGVVYYLVESGVLMQRILDNDVHEAVYEAIEEFHKKTCIKFKKIMPFKARPENYIKFIDGKGCASDIGMQGGEQTVILGPTCNKKSMVIHELMHILGWEHEQGRPDREKFIEIIQENIMPGYEDQFKIYDATDSCDTEKVKILPSQNGGAYCFSSVMHYQTTHFAKARGLQTMRPRVETHGKIGMSPGLDECDVKRIQYYYGCQGEVSTAPLVGFRCFPPNHEPMYDGDTTTTDGNFLKQCFASRQRWDIKRVACLDANYRHVQPPNLYTDRHGRQMQCVKRKDGDITFTPVTEQAQNAEEPNMSNIPFY